MDYCEYYTVPSVKNDMKFLTSDTVTNPDQFRGFHGNPFSQWQHCFTHQSFTLHMSFMFYVDRAYGALYIAAHGLCFSTLPKIMCEAVSKAVNL